MAKNKSKKRRKIIVFTLMGLVLAGLTAWAVLRKREVTIGVQVEPVTRRNLTELVAANGKIQPVIQVVINPEISGEIVELPVKEGQKVDKGDVLVRIKPDNYIASTNSSFAMLQGAMAAEMLAGANLAKAEWEYQRVEKMHQEKLVSDFDFQAAKTSRDVASAQRESSIQQAKQARAALARSLEDLAKTTIVSPICGTVTKLRSEAGERVVGSAMMTGTEIMTIADLDDMEARVDIGEIDIVLVEVGQKARLEVDAFRDRKFNGTVTEIANAVKSGGGMSGGSSQEAAKFEVKVRISEKEEFRPGMSVTAEVETRYRTNVLTVPIQSVTTRMPKPPPTNAPSGSNLVASVTNQSTNAAAEAPTNTVASTNLANPTPATKKPGEPPKPIEVVFVVEGDRTKMVPVKRGVSDENFTEIVEGLTEGQKVVSGGYKAINRDLEDGKKVRIETAKPGDGQKPPDESKR